MKMLIFLSLLLLPSVAHAQTTCTPSWCGATATPNVCSITVGVDSCGKPCYKPSTQWPVQGCLPPAPNHLCAAVMECKAVDWPCPRKVQTFATYADFQTWLAANPSVSYTVIWSSNTQVSIEYFSGCTPTVQCSDAQGICQRK